MSKATLTAAMIETGKITKLADFRFRYGAINNAHKADLAKTILNNEAPLDPILVWQSPDPATPLILLDGWHRLAAYRAAGWAVPIPAMILEGDRRSALSAALEANSKHVLPMLQEERMDAAWRLVREPVEPRFKVPEVARMAGVGRRSVDHMRRRWKEMQEADKVPVGEWRLDRQDECLWQGDPSELLTDEERAEQLAALVVAIRDVLDRRKHPHLRILQDSAAVNDAICEALGRSRIQFLAEYSGEAPEDAEEWAQLRRNVTDDDSYGSDEVLPQF